jgi:hypothetical protein
MEKNYTPEQAKAFREYACAALNSLQITKDEIWSDPVESIAESSMIYATEVARGLMIQEGIL